MKDVLKRLRERLEQLLERDLSWEEREKLMKALESLQAFEETFADLGEEVKGVLFDQAPSPLELMDRV